MIIPYARLGHVGFLVRDLDVMINFYTRVLGLMLSDRGVSGPKGGEFAFLSRDPKEHHQVVFQTGRQKDVPSQIVQLSFEMGSLPDLRAMHEIVKADAEVTDIQTRAHGIAWSMYFKDPEDNILEMFVSTPWYIPAPSAIPFDFSMSDEQIFVSLRDRVKQRAGYKSYDAWREESERRMLEAGVWSRSEA